MTSGEATFAHHQDTVGNTDDLLQFAAGKQNRNSPARQFIDQVIDFFLCPNIDAPRWFIEQQY